MEYPICYVVKDLRHETYFHQKPSYGLSLSTAEAYYNDKTSYAHWYFTDKIVLAKMWTSVKKIKRYLTADAAKYFVIIGSDKSILLATDLFE